MAGAAPLSERPDAGLVAALEAAHIHPLWDRYKRITPVQPNAPDIAFHWRWSEIEPFAKRAPAEVAIEDVERRALIMCNAAFGGQTVTTSNLIAAFSVLKPGDRAVPHRHVAAAIRFATNAEGAATIVNGRRCEPPMCWHGHINESDGPISWFDAANMPLINTLDVNFFEPGEHSDNSFWQVDEGDERLWQAAGMVAPHVEPKKLRRSAPMSCAATAGNTELNAKSWMRLSSNHVLGRTRKRPVDDPSRSDSTVSPAAFALAAHAVTLLTTGFSERAASRSSIARRSGSRPGSSMRPGIESGQPLSASFLDHAIPRAEDFPFFVAETDESQPCTFNPLGAKGCGESGAIGAPAAVTSAVLDALSSLGVTDIVMPITPERVWRAIRAVRPE